MANPVTTVLTELTTCLCSQIIADGLPSVCVCGTMPGESVSLDYSGDCDDACGMATVRLAAAYPSSIVGQPSVTPGNCALGIGIDVELAIIRCVEVGDEGGQPPPPAVLAAAATLQYDDMMAMWRAVLCCRQSKDFVITAYAPFGPEGGLVGGALTVSILVL